MNEAVDTTNIEPIDEYAALTDGLQMSVSDEVLESAGGVMTGQMTASSSNSNCC